MVDFDEYRLQRKLMGCDFELIICSDDEKSAKLLLDKGVREIKRIEMLLSEFIPTSITSKINKNAGIGSLRIPEEVYNLLERCLKLSELTQGAFDISVGPLKKLYDFKKREPILPVKEILKQTLTITGYKNIYLGKNFTVSLAKQRMFISFAPIGKGYAADQVKKLWLKNGIRSGVINASGDLCVVGKKPDGSPWKIGIPNPEKKSEMLLFFPVEDGAVATSGDYEQYFISQGKRYSHTIDPFNGLPIMGIKSVTVTCHSAELCDALATAVTVMGVETGLHFINQFQGMHCLIIDDDNKSHFSKNITFEKTM
jgi:thiamine biosynthesis lipoprotein